MAASASSRGFTLVELLIATTILAIVATGICSATIGSSRLLRIAFAEAELSVRTRELRDKLLFHAAPPHDNTVWAGLLSGTNAGQVVEGNATKIRQLCTALQYKNNQYSGGARAQTIELVFRDAGLESCSLFSEDRIDANSEFRWLRPGNLNFFAGSPTPSGIVRIDTTDPGRFYVNVSARKTVAGLSVEHAERIVVPVFGRTQQTENDGTGGL